jgi:hypothetical protein
VIRNCPASAPTFASKASKILAGKRHERATSPRLDTARRWPWSASSIGTASKAIGRDIHIATFMLLRIPTPSRLIRVKVASQKSGGIGLYI